MSDMNLFEDFDNNLKIKPSAKYAPLADRMRPLELDEFIGQEHIVGKGKILQRIIEEDRIFSMILWGPPGCGKTTLARIIANKTESKFISYSAVISGIKQIKDVMEIAQVEQKTHNKRTIIFIDEIHRFNKAQQDAFLPYVEEGTIILIGATTENPSFEIISALLSRCKVFVLNKLNENEITVLLKRALTDKKRGYGNYNIKIDNETIEFLARYSDGDSRIAYNILELAVTSFKIDETQETNEKTLKNTPIKIDIRLIENIIQKKALLYDKAGEEHFNIISAMHKSLRGSDPDAAVYWTIRMLESGEDPLYVLRRMVRFASEDIGLADPNALGITIAAKAAFEFIGPPEGYLAIIQAAIYLALTPKSNALYKTYSNAMEDIKRYQSLPVPYHIRNAPTKLMKNIGYSKGYIYPHNHENAIVYQSYLPDEIKGKKYYFPTERGFEKDLKLRLEKITEYKQKLKNSSENK
jgi:ATPase related to the helicase subunit of the Holliday junction resolvase